MKKGRSVYTFSFNCDLNQINSLIQSYMNANGFKQENDGNEIYYKAGDAMVGYRYFNYNIAGNSLTVYAWLKGAFGDIEIENGGISIPIMTYRNSLNKLFQEIEKLNNNTQYMWQPTIQNIENNNSGVNIDSQAGNTINQNYQQQMQQNNNFTQTFQNETLKKQEKLCEIGFWLSLLGLLCSLGGVTYGILIYIMNFYFASQGLKTKKSGKAKATIVLSIISILIVILQLM